MCNFPLDLSHDFYFAPRLSGYERLQYRSVIPVVLVPDCFDAVLLYGDAFGAVTIRFSRVPTDGDGNGWAAYEMQIGSQTRFIVSDYGGAAPSFLRLEVKDVDAAVERAVKNGCQITSATSVDECLGGATVATVLDSFGHYWQLCCFREALGDSGFLNRISIDALIIFDNDAKSLSRRLRLAEQKPPTTPLFTITWTSSLQEAFTLLQEGSMDMVFCSLDSFKEHSGWIRDPLDAAYTGLVVGIAPTDASARDIERFMDEGGDFIIPEPVTPHQVHQIFLRALKRKSEPEAFNCSIFDPGEPSHVVPDINQKDEVNAECMREAINNGDISTVKKLLSEGVSYEGVDRSDVNSGYSPSTNCVDYEGVDRSDGSDSGRSRNASVLIKQESGLLMNLDGPEGKERLEKKKAQFAEKMNNKVALIHKQADEKKAL